MMSVFILEDSYSRNHLFTEQLGHANVVIATTVEKGKEAYAKYAPFDLILLDHDLEDEHYQEVQGGPPQLHGTGTEFARWLATQQPTCPVIIHSFNPAGAERMTNILRDGGWYNVIRKPFGMELLGILGNTKNDGRFK